MPHEIPDIGITFQISKHKARFHVMSIHHAKRIREIGRVAAIEKYAAGERKFTARVLVQILLVGFALHHWVIDARAVDRKPPDDIGVLRAQFIKRFRAGARRFP